MYTLLIADDEGLEREALRYIIQRGNERIDRIIEAANGREAVEYARSQEPDIAILDIKMPGTNGVEAARKIKEFLPSCRIIFLTAFDTFDYAREALRLGAEDFLVKPVEDDRVLEILNDEIDDLDRERHEQQAVSRSLETLKELEAQREAELSRQLGMGYPEPERIREYLLLHGIGDPRICLGLLKVDLNSYPMKIERPDHAEVLLGRCGQLCRRAAKEAGWLCLTGKRPVGNENPAGEIVTLFCRSVDNVARSIREVTEEIRQLIRSTVSLSCSFMTKEETGNPENLLKDILSVKGSGSSLSLPSSVRLEDALQRYLQEGDDKELDALMGKIVLWVDSHSDRSEGLRRAGELVLMSRNFLRHRFPSIQEGPEDEYLVQLAAGDGSSWKAELKMHLLSMNLSVQDQISRQEHPAVRFTVNLLKENFSRDLPIDEIAAAAGQSPSHLSRLFRQQLGMSIVDYLTGIRIDAARGLLAGSNRTIREISCAVGYGDANYFSRIFRRETGQTPREYRLSRRQ